MFLGKGRSANWEVVLIRTSLSPETSNLVDISRPAQVKGSHRALIAFIKVDRITLKPAAHQRLTEQAVRQQGEA